MKKLSQLSDLVAEVLFFSLPFVIIVGTVSGMCDDLRPKPIYKFFFYGTWGLFILGIILMLVLDILSFNRENKP